MKAQVRRPAGRRNVDWRPFLDGRSGGSVKCSRLAIAARLATIRVARLLNSLRTSRPRSAHCSCRCSRLPWRERIGRCQGCLADVLRGDLDTASGPQSCLRRALVLGGAFQELPTHQWWLMLVATDGYPRRGLAVHPAARATVRPCVPTSRWFRIAPAKRAPFRGTRRRGDSGFGSCTRPYYPLVSDPFSRHCRCACRVLLILKASRTPSTGGPSIVLRGSTTTAWPRQ